MACLVLFNVDIYIPLSKFFFLSGGPSPSSSPLLLFRRDLLALVDRFNLSASDKSSYVVFSPLKDARCLSAATISVLYVLSIATSSGSTVVPFDSDSTAFVERGSDANSSGDIDEHALHSIPNVLTNMKRSY